MLRRQVAITQRHLDIGVAYQFADGIDIHANHDQLAGEVVPQVVKTEVLYLRRIHQTGP